jgi:hypothetical protein
MSQYDSKDKSTADVAEARTIYRDVKPGASSESSSAVGSVNSALSQAGSGMAHPSGATFHDNATSHAAADALGANAFTAGSDVYFGAGQLQPSTPSGGALISHELTHVSQARGVEAPQPGNFRVSSPSDHAEVAARGGSGGGAAAPSTIHRDDHGGPAPAAGGAGPAAGAGGTAAPAPAPAPGGTAGAAPADPYEAFKTAINARNRGDSLTKWGALTSEQKAKVGTEGEAFQRGVLYTLHKDAPKVLKAGNVPLTPMNVYTIFLDEEFDQWLPEMRTVGLLTPFLLADPLKGMVSTSVANQLAKWVGTAASIAEAKAIFQKVYPTLLDTAALSQTDINNGISVVAWQNVAQISHLFTTLASFLPTGHAQTIQGFFLMTTTSGKVWGWWQPWNYLVALPLHSGAGSAALDKSDHGGSDMTGGSGSGANSPTGGNTYTGPDGVAGGGKNAQLGHFEGTILHEVGHGVGAKMGGDAYALNPSSYPGFHAIGASAWADEMWAAPTGTGDTSVSENARKIDDAHAKAFMIGELTNGENSYTYNPGWFHSNPTRADVAKWISTRYSNVPLQKWWKHIVLDKTQTADDSYSWDDAGVRVKGDKVYGILTRADPSPGRYMKWNTEAFNKKVSWYGQSSPLEWWAEQYSHYYRTEKTGGGLIDDTTKAMLDRLDKTAYAPTSADGSTGVTYPTSGSATGGGGPAVASSGGGGGGQLPANSTAATATPRPQAQRKEPLFFPW